MTKKEQMYEDLKARILTMDLEPDCALDERGLCERYMLSRPPVREVLQQLAGHGYLVIEKNRGAFVSPMNNKTLHSFFKTAPPIYATIAALAAQNSTAEQRVELKDAQRQFCKAVKNKQADEMAYANNLFHSIMGEMADNKYLWPTLQRLLIDHSRIGQTFYRPRNKLMRSRLELASDHHEQFIVAIEEQDHLSAKQLAVDHWDLSQDYIDLLVGHEPLNLESIA